MNLPQRRNFLIGAFCRQRLYLTITRDIEIRRDFQQWKQNESTLMHAWMGNLQIGNGYFSFAIQQNIQINTARAISLGAADAALPCLDRRQNEQQFCRLQRGLQRTDSIYKIGLIGESYRRRAI